MSLPEEACMATKQEIIASIRAGMERVPQTFGSLTDAQLATKVHDGDNGWTAKQILAHLAGRQASYDRAIDMAERGASMSGGFDLNAWNQEHVDARKDRSRDELLAEVTAVHWALIDRVSKLPDETLTKTIQRPNGTFPLSDALRMSGGQHSIMHAAEVEQALGLPEGGVLALPGQNDLNAPFGSLHHVALVTNDMKKTVAFYRDVLVSEVAMGHRLPRAGNERHYFITVAPSTVFAFFEFPDAEMPGHKDATLPSTGRSLDHIAFFAESEETFDRWYMRLQEVNAPHLSEMRQMGPGLRAFFFDDPNGIVLEVMAPPKGGGMRVPMLHDPDPAY
jgi:catechol 2,3-dioxygenase-like lactoylglutathione lyase family enzyme